MSYQDIYVRGSIESTGDRECADRYEAIRTRLLSRYSRPFTLLDLGAAEGYFSFRTVADNPSSVAVAVDDNPRLTDLCHANRLTGVIHLCHRFSPRDLSRLASCEHFDVVLALNVLHHFPPAEALDALQAILTLGNHIVIETPPPTDTGSCGQPSLSPLHSAVQSLHPRLVSLGRFPSHTSAVDREIVIVSRPKSTLTRAYLDVPHTVPLGRLTIDSTFSSKVVTFHDKDEGRRDWIHGVNLRTYQLVGGVYPDPTVVGSWVASTSPPSPPHGDIRPWNFILDGRTTHLIDGRDDKAIYDDRESLASTAAQIAGGVE